MPPASVANGGGNFLAGSHPRVPSLHAQAQPLVIYPQVAVAAADHGLGHDRFDFLCHHADIGFAAAIVAEPVKAETVIETGQHDDVVLQADVGSPAAAMSATAVSATAVSATAVMTTATAAAAASTATEMMGRAVMDDRHVVNAGGVMTARMAAMMITTAVMI